jgi:uncharacterized membrane-anchored protein
MVAIMTISRVLVVLGAVIVLGAINVSIAGKERVIREGAVIFVELGPRDPRSLMQGDYMALRFELARQIEANARSGGSSSALPGEGETGFADIALDDKGIATLANPGATPSAKLRYRIRKGAVWLGTNAFFFEEGTDTRYAPARYGEFRLDKKSGEAVLVGLRDAQLKTL